MNKDGTAWFGTRTSPGIVVRVNLTVFPLIREDALTLNTGEDELRSSIMAWPYAYFAYVRTIWLGLVGERVSVSDTHTYPHAPPLRRVHYVTSINQALDCNWSDR